MTRDIAVLCESRIPVGEMQEAILNAGGETLKECRVFDVYTGDRIAAGMKSVAFSLTMRADDQTLTDEHAGEIVSRALSVLRDKFGAQMR